MNELSFLGAAEVMDSQSSEQSQVARRPSSTPIDVTNLFPSGATSNAIMPPPKEHIGQTPSSSSKDTIDTPSRPKFSPHSRSMSLADVARQGKRLSLTLPILPHNSGPSSHSSPSITQTPISPEWIRTPTSGNFLTALAAQERRVFELKEELSKAELELIQLKRHWATHEATKKRDDVRRSIQPLQPLNSTLVDIKDGADDDLDGSSLWLQREMERRKALMSGVKTSQRKVFSGSRHTRTLSLLSPDKINFTQPFPQPEDVNAPAIEPIKSIPLPRSATISAATLEEPPALEVDLSVLQREALLRTGKQMASDFKDGLLTFIEDLRQATVGDEGVNGTHSRIDGGQNGVKRQQSKGSLNGAPGISRKAGSSANKKTPANPSHDTSNLIDIGGSFWKENGVDEPKTSNTTKKTKPAAKTKKSLTTKPVPENMTPQKQTSRADDADEHWDTWDTPNNNTTTITNSDTSESEGRTSPDSSRSSPRTSTRNPGQQQARLDSLAGARQALPRQSQAYGKPSHERVGEELVSASPTSGGEEGRRGLRRSVTFAALEGKEGDLKYGAEGIGMMSRQRLRSKSLSVGYEGGFVFGEILPLFWEERVIVGAAIKLLFVLFNAIGLSTLSWTTLGYRFYVSNKLPTIILRRFKLMVLYPVGCNQRTLCAVRTVQSTNPSKQNSTVE
ncbi:hypothetical protein M501DRAFT_1029274 [Patellaria atrata CBS 101060]|uniref:DUF4048 domain-containing protein n=1 Tax=Patellaria atrata CBS 101060 TaxID=1346257 RepID=A0A9P4SG33_9PEZI|nr:hypothetical protein M501DRAFT_1029274 [Patellaria atrata CBS 101060]